MHVLEIKANVAKSCDCQVIQNEFEFNIWRNEKPENVKLIFLKKICNIQDLFHK